MSLGPPEIFTRLAIDAMYFHAARQSFEYTLAAQSRVTRASRRHDELRERAAGILQRYKGDHYRAYDELEPVYIQMEGTAYKIGAAMGPVLRAFAITHILCAATLESHINSQAEEFLRGFHFKKFSKMDLETKWLVFPRLMGLESFDPGAEPFQGFTQLVRFRNLLVHYRTHSEPWADPGVPGFLRDLGLTKDAAAKSIESVKGMVAKLAGTLKQKAPFWLESPLKDINYFYVK